MLTYMLDTNICIYVMKNYPPALREKFNTLAEQLCISSITLGELHYGAEKWCRFIMFPDSIPDLINVNLQRRDDCHPTGACCRAALAQVTKSRVF